MANITNAWKLTSLGSNRLVVEDVKPAFVVQYDDGTGNILVEGNLLLRDGVAFEHEPLDYLNSGKAFYDICTVPPEQVQ